jgi:PhnB protein
MAVNPIPSNYPRVTPYLSIAGAAAAIDFYTQVFGAVERGRMPGPNGTIGHAELEVGDSMIMLADESPEIGFRSPNAYGGSPVTIMVYVDDVDGVVGRAVQAGATVVRPVEDQFYGDRSGQFDDPFGHRWAVASHVEDVSPEEMERRVAELMAGGGGAGG